jgi:small basic protein
VRVRELRSPVEARRSLTKFVTIIIIALSLEAVVGILEAGRNETFDQLIYPAMVIVTAILALMFQFLSRSQGAAAADAVEEPQRE